MPVIRRYHNMTANQTLDLNLAPFDRFGGRGGRVSVRATTLAADINQAVLTVMVGSDVLADQVPVIGEQYVGGGPLNSTPAIVGVGAPSDPITVRLLETTGGTPEVTVEVNVENA